MARPRTAATTACASSRGRRRSPDELIRFVADPDGEIVPDLKRKLPGRGVWVTAASELVSEAVKRQAFARGLKAAVSAPADLAVRVERLAGTRRAAVAGDGQ